MIIVNKCMDCGETTEKKVQQCECCGSGFIVGVSLPQEEDYYGKDNYSDAQEDVD